MHILNINEKGQIRVWELSRRDEDFEKRDPDLVITDPTEVNEFIDRKISYLDACDIRNGFSILVERSEHLPHKRLF